MYHVLLVDTIRCQEVSILQLAFHAVQGASQIILAAPHAKPAVQACSSNTGGPQLACLVLQADRHHNQMPGHVGLARSAGLAPHLSGSVAHCVILDGSASQLRAQAMTSAKSTVMGALLGNPEVPLACCVAKAHIKMPPLAA